MVRTPHIYLAEPWDRDVLALPRQTQHHLESVLRRSSGAAVTYTDGEGRIGSGRLVPSGIFRGEEEQDGAGTGVHMVVAPPHRSERLRTLVEKLVELGVESIQWLVAERRQAKQPRLDKCMAWAIGALEQSGGAWLPQIGIQRTWESLTADGEVWVADGAASGKLPDAIGSPITLVVGPEGGFAPGEIPHSLPRFALAGTTLRIETAAVVAVAVAIDRIR